MRISDWSSDVCSSDLVFLEPEGLDDALVYPNGISTSLPPDVQAALVASIAGLERAKIVVPGYAVEYDHIHPRALSPTRSEERRVGKECVSTCRSRWSPFI